MRTCTTCGRVAAARQNAGACPKTPDGVLRADAPPPHSRSRWAAYPPDCSVGPSSQLSPSSPGQRGQELPRGQNGDAEGLFQQRQVPVPGDERFGPSRQRRTNEFVIVGIAANLLGQWSRRYPQG